MFLGLPGEDESEGFDRTHIDLPTNQLVLVHALAEVHDRLIVVLANGGVVRVSTWDDKVAAILECWLSGQAAGGAAVDLLLGVVNPSGKLAETIPIRLQDNSSYLNFPGEEGIVRYGEGIFIGYRAYDKLVQPVELPFGFGLSYTNFRVDDVNVSVAGSVADGDLAVTVTASVTNTGQLAGAEVVQVYVGDIEASVSRPLRELKGFAKVHLQPGETQQVSCQLDERAFAFWSQRFRQWVVESGEFTIAVGTSSRDLVATETITLDAPRLSLPLGPDSTLHEWLEDERGRELITRRDMQLLQDPEIDQGDWHDAHAYPGGIPRHGTRPRRIEGDDRRALGRRRQLVFHISLMVGRGLAGTRSAPGLIEPVPPRRQRSPGGCGRERSA